MSDQQFQRGGPGGPTTTPSRTGSGPVRIPTYNRERNSPCGYADQVINIFKPWYQTLDHEHWNADRRTPTVGLIPVKRRGTHRMYCLYVSQHRMSWQPVLRPVISAWFRRCVSEWNPISHAVRYLPHLTRWIRVETNPNEFGRTIYGPSNQRTSKSNTALRFGLPVASC